MGYYDALAKRDAGIESRDIAKKAAKKGLWGSVGRSLGSLLVTGLTAGTVNPITLGLMTGAGSFLGGAAGAAASGTGNLGKGRVFFKDEGEKLQKELGAFGSGNITTALKSGITAGIGQKLKLAKDARAAEAGGLKSAEEIAKIRKGVGFKESFKESFIGKGMEKSRLAAESKSQLANRSLQVGEGLVPSVGDTTGVGTGTLPTGESDIPDLYEMFQGELDQKPILSTSQQQQQSALMKYQTDRFAKSEQSLWGGGIDPAQGSQLNVSPSAHQWQQGSVDFDINKSSELRKRLFGEGMGFRSGARTVIGGK